MQEQTLFIEALEIASPAEQAAFLDRACAGDAALRQRIERLLQCHQQDDSFLEGAVPPLGATSAHASSAAGAAAGSAIAEQPGTIIGPYKLLEQIGEGGMGLVFMAEQQHPVRRKVALKLIKPGMDSQQVIARFEAERQALALMDHVNIAKVLEAGETSSGRPYFVMDLVKGLPITAFCDQNRLTPKERLELFVHVCQAVQHAHQKGIIHRDIKPSNVLVTLHDGTPLVKVIDFGIAKALGQQLTDKTLFTGFAQMIGTPLYMSPEQAGMSSIDVDTRSDIYSLGVLLYELLTGTTPFDEERLRQAGYDEMRRIIREEEPARPSTRISSMGQASTLVSAQRQSDPKRLSQLCRGELDWIVMKALEKDRNRRYETASALAMDVQRYLADEPVLACPPSAWYRLRKFARRNKSALVVAASLLLVVTSLAVSAGWITRDRAARRAQSLGRLQDGLTAARTLLAENKPALARQKLAEARAEIGNDRAGLEALADQLDGVELALDRWQRFFNLLDRAHEAEIVEGRWEPAEAVPFVLEAMSQYDVFERDDWSTRLKQGLLGQEQVQEIRRLGYEQLLWLADDVLRRGQDHRSEAKLSTRAAAQAAGAYLQKAETARRPTLAFYRLRAQSDQILGDKDRAAADRKLAQQTPPTMACDYYLQGLAAYALHNRDKGIQAFEAALRLEPRHYRSLEWLGYCLCDLGRGPEDFHGATVAFTGCIMMRPDYAHVHHYRGCAYYRLHQWDQAIADYTKALELDPKDLMAWFRRGHAYGDLKQWDKAIADYTRALELNPKYLTARGYRGFAYSELKQWDKALADYTRGIELAPKNMMAWHSRGRAYYRLHQWDQALADFTKALELEPKYVLAWRERGDVYAALKQWDQALAGYTRAIELDPKNPSRWIVRGNAYAGLKQWDKALADYTRAIELNPKNASWWIVRGNAYAGLKQWDKAIADYTRAIELNPKNASWWIVRGNAYAGLKQWDKALADYSKAIELNPKLLFAFTNRAQTYEKVGQWDKAIADYTKAIELDPKLLFAFTNRAQTYEKVGQWDKAIADYTKAIELDPKSAHRHNGLAWLLAANPNPEVRDPGRAVDLAKKAVELAPKEGNFWNTLGVAHYRAGDWKAAQAALEKSLVLRKGGDSFDWFFLAMSHEKLGEKEKARQWYDRAVERMDKNRSQDNELRRFRTEAAALLKIKEGQ